MERTECKLFDGHGIVLNLVRIFRRNLREKESYEQLETFDCELADIMKDGGNYEDVLFLIQKFIEPI